MDSLKILFDLSSGKKFLTLVKLNPIKSRGALYISGYLGLVMLAIDLLARSACVHKCYFADLFTILSKSHSNFHLKVIETIHILTHKPSLCKQRECLLALNLITIWFTYPFSKQLAFFPHLPLYYRVPAPCPFLIVCPRFTWNQRGLKAVVKFYIKKKKWLNLFFFFKKCIMCVYIYIYIYIFTHTNQSRV